MITNLLRIILIAYAFVFTNIAKAQTLSLSWAFRTGGGTSEEGKSMQSDVAGNVYVTGYFAGTADFDPGPGTVNLTALGGREIFLAKYHPDGSLLWAKKIGGTSDDYGNALQVDADGNVLLTGTFQGSVDFDPNAGTAFMSSSGVDDIFVAKYSSSGIYEWAFKIGGSLSDNSASLERDADGNLVLSGLFRSTVDFDPGAGAVNRSASGGSDIFLAKYTPTGQLIWVNVTGGVQDDAGTALQLDSKGNIYLSGNFQGTADFDPGINTSNLSANGLRDVFLACYDAAGNYLWANSFGSSTNDDGGNAMKIGSDGRIYMTGSFTGNADFDPGAGNALLTGIDEDIFLACYDTISGAFQWAKRIGGVAIDRATDLQVTSTGDIYLTGHFMNTCTFETGTPATTLSSEGGRDIFIGCYETNGGLKWVVQIGGSNDDSANTLLLREDGSLYLSGYFRGTVDFDPGPNTTSLTSSSFFDIFIAKYAQCLPATIVQNPDNQFVCANDVASFSATGQNAAAYFWQISTDGGSNWSTIADTNSGYTGINTNLLGIAAATLSQDGALFRMIAQSNCGLQDTSAAAALAVTPGSAASESIRICDGETYVFPDGASSDTSVVYISILQSANGCDSTITSILTVEPQFFMEESVAVCTGETYIFPDGTVGDSSVLHISVLATIHGCDSIISTELTVTQVNTGIAQDSNMLTSLGGSSQIIQWVDCTNDFAPIAGATTPVFVPSANGTYAAILQNGNCKDTSDCFVVIVIGTNEADMQADIGIYPNPTTESIMVEYKGYSSQGINIQMVNATGQIIYNGRFDASGGKMISLMEWPSGLYCLRLTEERGRVVSRVVLKQ